VAGFARIAERASQLAVAPWLPLADEVIELQSFVALVTPVGTVVQAEYVLARIPTFALCA
jgi:hypothetical protein